jgi:predicted lipoprotein with Yx(FWY)xxD motif
MPRTSTAAPGPSATSPSATTGPSPSATGVSSSPSPSPRPSAAKGTTIITADSQFGAMLFDASGQAIYLFDAERGSRPECYGECAEDWPPVLTTGRPRAKGAVQGDLLGTTRRKDGRSQVTYAGHPLYLYAHEGKHQVLCHDIEEYGGLWLVVQPDGDPAPH